MGKFIVLVILFVGGFILHHLFIKIDERKSWFQKRF